MTPSGSKRIVVCTPTRDGLSAETRHALRDNLDGFEGPVLTVVGKPVEQARNELAAHARMATDADMVLWVDDDAWWPPGTIARFADDLARFPWSVIGSSYSARHQYGSVCGATRADKKKWLIDPVDLFGMALSRAAKAGLEKRELTADELATADEIWPPAFKLRNEGELVEVLTIGGHFFAHRPEALWAPELRTDPFTWSTDMKQALIDRCDRVGIRVPLCHEDFAFSIRAQLAGLTLYVETGAPVTHIDRRSGVAYLPGQPAMRVKDNALVAWEGPVPAAAPRSWFEFRVFRSEDERRSQQLLDFIGDLFIPHAAAAHDERAG